MCTACRAEGPVDLFRSSKGALPWKAPFLRAGPAPPCAQPRRRWAAALRVWPSFSSSVSPTRHAKAPSLGRRPFFEPGCAQAPCPPALLSFLGPYINSCGALHWKAPFLRAGPAPPCALPAVRIGRRLPGRPLLPLLRRIFSRGRHRQRRTSAAIGRGAFIVGTIKIR